MARPTPVKYQTQRRKWRGATYVGNVRARYKLVAGSKLHRNQCEVKVELVKFCYELDTVIKWSQKLPAKYPYFEIWDMWNHDSGGNEEPKRLWIQNSTTF